VTRAQQSLLSPILKFLPNRTSWMGIVVLLLAQGIYAWVKLRSGDDTSTDTVSFIIGVYKGSAMNRPNIANVSVSYLGQVIGGITCDG
jgi:hypothetical protein